MAPSRPLALLLLQLLLIVHGHEEGIRLSSFLASRGHRNIRGFENTLERPLLQSKNDPKGQGQRHLKGEQPRNFPIPIEKEAENVPEYKFFVQGQAAASENMEHEEGKKEDEKLDQDAVDEDPKNEKLTDGANQKEADFEVVGSNNESTSDNQLTINKEQEGNDPDVEFSESDNEQSTGNSDVIKDEPQSGKPENQTEAQDGIPSVGNDENEAAYNQTLHSAEEDPLDVVAVAVQSDGEGSEQDSNNTNSYWNLPANDEDDEAPDYWGLPAEEVEELDEQSDYWGLPQLAEENPTINGPTNPPSMENSELLQDNNEGDESQQSQRPKEEIERLEADGDAEIEAEEGDAGEVDNFLPKPEPGLELYKPGYYLADLRPFSVLVTADYDVTNDLGVPLFLLLEMQSTLYNLVDIHITNLTIRMDVVHQSHEESSSNPNSVHSREIHDAEVHHTHWNELFFEGQAEFVDVTMYSEKTVQNVQMLVLSNEGRLQSFWEDEGSEVYSSIEVVDITLLDLPTETEEADSTDGDGTIVGNEDADAMHQEQEETEQPDSMTQEQKANTGAENEISKRDSNVWIMVSMVLLFLLICFCIIGFAGRLRYLGSRAQERYNEKYGLDYNVYDKDISKDVFKEEYLYSTHDHSDGNFYVTESVNFLKQVRRDPKGKKSQPADDETPTTEDEDEPHSEAREIFSNEGDEVVVSSKMAGQNEAASASKVDCEAPNDEGRSAPMAPGDGSEGGPACAFQDEGIVLEELSESEGFISQPPVQEVGVTVAMAMLDRSETARTDDGDVKPQQSSIRSLMASFSGRDRSSRSIRSNASSTMVSQEKQDRIDEIDGSSRRRQNSKSMDGSAHRRRSSRSSGNSSHRRRGSKKMEGSSLIRDDSVAMGNSSIRSTRSILSNRSSNSKRSNRSYFSVDSFHSNANREDRSTRSHRSMGSASSFGSFYSAQGDLV